jgi:PAP2 superfamily
MSTTAAASTVALTADRPRRGLAERHSLFSEFTTLVVLYGLYELARGIVVGDPRDAVRHAHDVVTIEQSLHLFIETRVQDAARAVPGMAPLLGSAYLTLHLVVTGATLLWLHQRRPQAFPSVRTTLVVTSGLAVVGFLAFPTAPPRLAGVGIADTVSGGYIDLNRGLVSSLYNPYAAVPSMHIAYAIVVAAALVQYSTSPLVRVAAALYPLFVLLVVIATGNHFFFDAAAGAAVAGVAFAVTADMTDRHEATSVSPRPPRSVARHDGMPAHRRTKKDEDASR